MPGTIPPKATLIFEVELVAISGKDYKWEQVAPYTDVTYLNTSSDDDKKQSDKEESTNEVPEKTDSTIEKQPAGEKEDSKDKSSVDGETSLKDLLTSEQVDMPDDEDDEFLKELETCYLNKCECEEELCKYQILDNEFPEEELKEEKFI